jgi:hypothetical protein
MLPSVNTFCVPATRTPLPSWMPDGTVLISSAWAPG